MASSLHRASSEKAAAAAVIAPSDHGRNPCRDVHEGARGLHDDEPVTRSERLGEFGADGNDPISAEHDLLARSQAGQFADIAHDAAVTIGLFGARMGGMNSVVAPTSHTSLRLAPVVVVVISERVGR